MFLEKGMKFYDQYSGTHTITKVTDNGVFHEYTDGKRKITNAFIYRHVFEKLVKQNVFWIL